MWVFNCLTTQTWKHSFIGHCPPILEGVTNKSHLLCLLFVYVCSVAQSCPTLCNHMDCSLPASSIHGILQTRILEWLAMPYFKGSSWLRDQTCLSYISRIGGQVLYYLNSLGIPPMPSIYLVIPHRTSCHLTSLQALSSERSPGG